MREISGDIWRYHKIGGVVAVTTNGVVKNDGRLVMGKGIALKAANLYPELPKIFGDWVKKRDNFPMYIMKYNILSFPTKYHWKDNASISLVKGSAELSMRIADEYNLNMIFCPRFGCGLDGLKWEDVREAVTPILDDRFIVMDKIEHTLGTQGSDFEMVVSYPELFEYSYPLSIMVNFFENNFGVTVSDCLYYYDYKDMPGRSVLFIVIQDDIIGEMSIMLIYQGIWSIDSSDSLLKKKVEVYSTVAVNNNELKKLADADFGSNNVSMKTLVSLLMGNYMYDVLGKSLFDYRNLMRVRGTAECVLTQVQIV